MRIYAAKLLSWILHPLLMPLYGIIMVFYYNPLLSSIITHQGHIIIYLTVIISTVLLPCITTWILLKRGSIKSLMMETKEERRLPFLSTLIYYLAGYYVLMQMRLPGIFYLIILATSVAIIAAIFINMLWKISIHLIGIGGITGMLMGMSERIGTDLYYPLIISILCAGLLGTARLTLNSHNHAQIYSGFIVGFFCEFCMLVFA